MPIVTLSQLERKEYEEKQKEKGCKECDYFYWDCDSCMSGIVDGKNVISCKKQPNCSCCGGNLNHECNGELWNKKKEIK